MKRFSCALFALTAVLVSIRSLSAQVQGQWKSTGALQSAREFNAQLLMINGKVLSVGGVDNSGNLLASAETFTPSLGAWALTGSMAEARQQFPAVLLPSGMVLVSGGLGAAGTVLGGAELYDPTMGTWSPAGSLSVARFSHTATLLHSGEVLVTGGCTASTCSTDTAVSELYDPATNSWSTTGSLSTARYYHTAVRLQSGEVLAIGGSTGAATTSCELYNPSTRTWSNAANTNVARYLNGATLLPDGKVLITGGTQSHYPINSAELYDPSANTWTLTGNMATGRYAHTATLLTDGTVLVAGGVGQPIGCGTTCYTSTATAEIYDEAAGKFTPTGSLSEARAYHSTTRLGNGRALADGGTGVVINVLGTAEILTPLTTTFSASSLNFGFLQIGLTSASQTVTVTNVSSHSVTFASIAGSGDFFQSNTCPPTLDAGLNCTITVTFTPTAAGIRKGAVTLNDNDPGSSTQTIALVGIGEVNAISFSPGSLHFPGQAPGVGGLMSVTLINDGNVAVDITGIAISPVNATFIQTNNCPATLNVQQSCVLQVTFRPPDTGSYKATLSVTDNSTNSPQTMSLTGIGLNN